MKVTALNVSAVGWDEKNPCDDFNASSSKEFTDAKCRFDGKTETVTGRFDRKKAGGLTITGTKYRFDLLKAMEGYSDKNKTSNPMALPEKKNQTQIDELKKAGVRYDYIVKMPGKVTGHSGCEIQSDGSAKFDILELVAKDKPYVESDTGLLGSLLGGGGDTKKDTTKTTGASSGKKAIESDDDATGDVAKSVSTICPCIPALTLILGLLGAACAKIM